MELQQLEQFLVVARLEHLTKAAQLLHLTQPALSRSLARLEESLGHQLFDRTGRGIRLNQEGKIFQKHVQEIFQHLNQAQQELDHQQRVQPLRLGVTTPWFFHRFLSHLTDRELGLPVQISSRHPNQLREKFLAGELDLLLNSQVFHQADIVSLPLLTDPVLLLAPRQTGIQQLPQLAEWKNLPFILPDSELEARQLVDDFFETVIGQPATVSIEANDLMSICEFVAAGLGYTLINQGLWQRLSPSFQDSITALSLDQLYAGRPYYLHYHPHNKDTATLVKQLINWMATP